MSSCIPICACVFSGKLSFSSANQITFLRAKSLATEIKLLCFVVMDHKILFKIRLKSRKLEGREKKKKEEAEEMEAVRSEPSI